MEQVDAASTFSSRSAEANEAPNEMADGSLFLKRSLAQVQQVKEVEGQEKGGTQEDHTVQVQEQAMTRIQVPTTQADEQDRQDCNGSDTCSSDGQSCANRKGQREIDGNVDNSCAKGRSFQGWDNHWCHRGGLGKQDLYGHGRRGDDEGGGGEEEEGKQHEKHHQQHQPYHRLNLSNEVKLCTLLQALSNHVQKRTVQLSSSISELESKLSQVDYDVHRVIMYDLISSDHQSVLFQASEEYETAGQEAHQHGLGLENTPKGCHKVNDEEDEPTGDRKDDARMRGQEGKQESDGNTNGESDQGQKEVAADSSCASMSGLDKMHREEEEAVRDGIKALSIFHDHSNSHSASTGSADQNEHPRTPPDHHYFGSIGEDEADDGENDDDDDSFYCYESSPGDMFNQRPLPFVIGSTEFLESVDGGIGGDIVQEDNDDEYAEGSYGEYESNDEDY